MARKLFPLKKINTSDEDYIFSQWTWNGFEFFSPCFLGENNVKFLNHQMSLKDESCWNDAFTDKLWLYNLHYFDDLNCNNSLSRKQLQLALIKRWINENPPPVGNGWEPYPLSLRLVNWIKWYNRAQVDDQSIVNSIALQAKALTKQIEYHILGNHLFANGKALVFAGCFLKGDFADRCLKLGLSILKRETPEQFLDDGGHFELSPMYHAILLCDLLDLINLSQCTGNVALKGVECVWRDYASRALAWLKTMTHPDDEICFFNDSAFDIAATPAQICMYASSLGIIEQSNVIGPLHTLKQSGYSRIELNDHVLFFDHADVGPDYLPGHAHADTLSVEWSVMGQRVLVNSGTSIYGVSDERLSQRKTAAHNTVVVDGQDSSEVWSGFRVARRAYSKLERAIVGDDSVSIKASHNGFRRLKGRVTHSREIYADKSFLNIKDVLDGRFQSAVVYYHLHPDIIILESDDSSLLLKVNKFFNIQVKVDGEIFVEDSNWHPRFGESVASKRFKVKFHRSQIAVSFNLIQV
ncbi:alginate lyase family protein [Vibrio cyclitrophicus]|nr:alginate lyase family protein [Vibrio cyclitrophicus]